MFSVRTFTRAAPGPLRARELQRQALTPGPALIHSFQRPRGIMDNQNSFFAQWSPRVLSILRIVVAFVFVAHGSQKLFGYPSMPAPPPTPPQAAPQANQAQPTTPPQQP